MQSIHRQLQGADRIILAAPVFFMGLPAQAKAMIDRCQALWVEKYLLKRRHMFAQDGSRRRGLWLSVGGRKGPDLFGPSRATVRAFFATLDLEFWGELLYPQVDPYQAILSHPTTLAQAREAGARLVKDPGLLTAPAPTDKMV